MLMLVKTLWSVRRRGEGLSARKADYHKPFYNAIDNEHHWVSGMDDGVSWWTSENAWQCVILSVRYAALLADQWWSSLARTKRQTPPDIKSQVMQG